LPSYNPKPKNLIDMKTKNLILLAICACSFSTLMAQNKEKTYSYDQIFHEKINFVRLVSRANAKLIIDTTYKEDLNIMNTNGVIQNRVEENPSKISFVYHTSSTLDESKINVTSFQQKGLCTIILDTLVISYPKDGTKGEIVVTLSSQPRNIILDSLASANITYAQDMHYLDLVCRQESKCLLPSKISTDTLCCEAWDNSEVVFDTLFIKRINKIVVHQGAKYIAKTGSRDKVCVPTYGWIGGKAEINLYGQQYFSINDITPKIEEPIKRLGSISISEGLGLNSIVQGNNGDYNANDFSLLHFFFDIMMPINITKHQTFAFGIGISCNTIRMEYPINWGTKENGTEGFIKYDIPATVSNYKSILSSINITLPFAYKWYMTDKRTNNILEAKLIPSYSLYSRLQNSYKENDKDYKELIKASGTFNKLQLNARLEYYFFGNFGIYIDYGLTPFLNTSKEKRMNILSFGITINTFE